MEGITMQLRKRMGLIFFLVLSLLIQINPVNVQADTQANTLKSVVSIDAGRKYFSEDQLKEIIEKAYQNGYTSVQILLGNDGLRFVLDDMTLNVDGKTYVSKDVIKGIKKGNISYYDDPNGNVLTQDEMDRILNYAKERSIDIIPVINSPGHMDAILVTMEELGIEDVRYTNGEKVSERTVNIENEHAVKFVQELIKHYAQYFGSSGVVEIFNFGADEYANDVFTSPGWGELQRLGLYEKFITYANNLSKIIKSSGMRPMSFNDGIYYNKTDRYGDFDKDIIISYWTSGWWGFDVASPDFFIEKGHDILNTNDHWYWVLGNINDGGYHYENALKNTKKIPFNQLTNGSTVKTIGSMQAIWADDPSKPHDMERIMNLLDLFSETHHQIMIRPADYKAVDEAIEAIPRHEGQYTDDTWACIVEALNEVERGLRITEQDRVDAMASQIIKAVEGLALKSADYTVIYEALDKVNTLDKNLYNNFEVVQKAVDAVDYELSILEQDKVEEMAENILQAINQLEKKQIDMGIESSENEGDNAKEFTQEPSKKTEGEDNEVSRELSEKLLESQENKFEHEKVLPKTGIESSLSGLFPLLTGLFLVLKRYNKNE